MSHVCKVMDGLQKEVIEVTPPATTPKVSTRPFKPFSIKDGCRKLTSIISSYPGYPKCFLGLTCILVAVCIALWAERQSRMSEVPNSFARRGMLVPNYYHVWWAHDLIFANSKQGRLNSFGVQLEENENNWEKVCPLDADSDGLTNGEELGDPCCLWKSPAENVGWSLQQRREYRRWNLSHPANPKRQFDGFVNAPVKCEDYDDKLYKEQFRKFYFDRHDGYSATSIVPAKIAGAGILGGLLIYWSIHKGLLGDIAPFCSRSAGLSTCTSVAVCVASHVYMDLVSGVVHLILDYAPHWIPVLGGLARGFQYHHADPTAIIRITWYAYVSHVHLLAPLVAILLFLSDASRIQRLFWFWGSVNVHAFQTAHRWAHMPPEALNGIVLGLQDWGILLTHDKHMQHHEDLERQFTILSGHTDLLLDTASQVVPPQRYDLWLFVGVVWFICPIFMDMHFRRFFESFDKSLGKALKVVDSSVEPSHSKDIAV